MDPSLVQNTPSVREEEEEEDEWGMVFLTFLFIFNINYLFYLIFQLKPPCLFGSWENLRERKERKSKSFDFYCLSNLIG